MTDPLLDGVVWDDKPVVPTTSALSAPDKQGIVWDSEPVLPDAEGVVWDKEPVVESPGLGLSVAQGVADTVLGGSAGLVTTLAGGLVRGAGDLLGDNQTLMDAGDAIFKRGDDTRKIVSEMVLTPEEREAQTIPEKVAGGLAAVPVMMAAGPAGAVLGGLMAQEGASTGAIKAGESTSSANVIGLTQGASVLAMLRVPAFGKTLEETAGLTLLSGPLAGAAADKVSEIAAKTEQGKSPYAMHNPDGSINKDYFANRITETLSGGAIGVYGHQKWKQLPDTRLADKWNAMDKAEQDAYFQDKDAFVKDIFKFNEWQSAHQPGEDWATTRERFFATNPGLTDYIIGKRLDDAHQMTNVPQALEIVYHTTDDPYTKAYSAYLLERAAVEGLNWSSVITLTRDQMNKYKTMGQYDPNTDNVFVGDVFKKQGQYDETTGWWMDVDSSKAFEAVLLHEIGHARTLKNLSEKIHAGDKQAIRFKDSIFPAIAKKIKQHNQIPDPAFEQRNEGRWRGFDDIYEFFTEVTNPPLDWFPHGNMSYRYIFDRNFRQDLMDVPISEKEAAQMMPPKETALIPANTQRLYDVLRGNDPNITNLYDVAVAWHEYLSRGVNSRRALTAGKFNKDLSSEYEGVKAGPLAAEGEKAGLQQRISDEMAGSSKDMDFWRSVWYHMQTAADNMDFKVKLLNIEPTSEALAKFVQNNADNIWDRKDFYAEVLSTEFGNTDKLNDSMKNLVTDDRTAYEFQRDWAERALEDTSDINIGWFGRNFFNPSTIRLLVDKKGFAGAISRFIIDKGMQYTHAADKIYHQLKTQDAKEYYKLSKASQRKVMGAASWYDLDNGGRKVLIEKEIQWPDAEMLKNQGLSDEEVQGYLGLARATDNAFNIVNIVMKKLNQPEIQRIPGFMPHYHAGPYKVHLTKTFEIDGELKERTVIVRGFKTGWGAEKFAKQMQERGFGIADPRGTGKLYQVFKWDDVGNSMLQTYKDHVAAYLNLQDALKKGTPEQIKSLQEAEDIAMREFNKHALEREDIRGYIGEYGAGSSPWDSPYARFANKVFGESDALHIHDKYFREVSELYKNVMFMEEVYAPLMGMDTAPMGAVARTGRNILTRDNTFKYLEKFGKNFLGKNLNHLAWVDNSFRTLMLAAKLDPNLVKNTNRTLRNMLGQIKLRVNPANWAANYLQKTHTIAIIQYLDLISGQEAGGGLRAFTRVNTKTPEELGPAHMRALRKARNDHIVDPLLDMEIGGEQKGLFDDVPVMRTVQKGWRKLGDVNRMVEKHGRENSFLTAFDHYLAKGLSEENAYRAAEIVMGMTMVNYDRAARPLMYQDLGMVGEAMSPFAVFRNAALGNMYLMLKTLKEHPDKYEAAKPFMTSMLTFMAMAGASGIPLVGEYNMLANAWNYMWPGDSDLPEAEILMLKAGVPDALLYGLPSEAAKLFGFERGINFGASAGAVSVDDAGSFAMLPFYKALSQLATLTAQTGASYVNSDIIPPSITDAYDPMRKVTPNILHPFIERFMSGSWERGLKSTSVEGLTTRDPSDIASLLFSGKHSIAEKKERTIERYIDRLDAKHKKNLAKLVELRADIADGLPTPWDGATIDKRVMVYYDPVGGSIDMFYKRVAQEIARRKVSKKGKEALAVSPRVLYRQHQRRLIEGGAVDDPSVSPDMAVPEPNYTED